MTNQVERSIPFVDAHHHLWELARLSYPWLLEPGIPGQDDFLGDYKAIRADWGPSRLAREFYGQHVVATVHVEAACEPNEAVSETEWLAGVADEFGFPNALIVYCDLTQPNASARLEAHLEASDLVRGVRARPEMPMDASFRAGLRAVGRLGLSYEFTQSPGALTQGLDLALAMPDLTITVAHTGMPMRRDPDYFALWQREMTALASAPNVNVKISGLGMRDHDWTIDTIRPWVLEAIDIFGVERCVFGTNWPVDLLYSPYTEVVDAYRLLLRSAGLADTEQHALLHGNAERLYKIGTFLEAEAAS